MTDAPLWDFIVLGAGLSGLAFADEATRLGHSVLLLERDAQVGGLSRTLSFGSYHFDLGGHRFHTPLPDVQQYVQNALPEDWLEVGRRSRIRLNGRYVDYPLRFPNAFTALGAAQSVKIGLSYLWAIARRHAHKLDRSFEDWVTRRFGRALYNIYFRPYTEKVWGMDCRELSSDWASQRIQLPSLLAAVQGSISRAGRRPATLVSRFSYPRRGIGMLPDSLAQRALSSGKARLALTTPVQRLERDEDTGSWRIWAGSSAHPQSFAGRRVISTLPLRDLLGMLPESIGVGHLGSSFSYRSLICIFLALEGPAISADTWTYFPDPGLLLGRTHEPPNWSPQMAPAGHTSLCIEVFCNQEDPVWLQPDDQLIGQVRDDLHRLGLVNGRPLHGAWLERVPDAYPIYRVGYGDALQAAHQRLDSAPGLHLLGRTGSFQYLNMDAVIRDGRALAVRLNAPASIAPREPAP